jgi:hypothetical protein
MASAKHQVATTNLPGMPTSSDTDELDISDSEPSPTASGGKGSVVHRDVTSAELAAQIATWQDVGDTKNKFCASSCRWAIPLNPIYGRCLGSRHTFLKCVFITAGPIIKLCAWGRRIVEDMCYEIRRAEACVD